jgi:type I restriction enzyme S subunit
LNSQFFAAVITSHHGKAYFTSTSQQTTNLACTNSTKIREFPVPLPPLHVQNRIVTHLNCETARVDALIEKKERLITLLEEKRAAMINRAVTKGLDLSAPMKDSGIPWLGEIPANWEVKRLLHLTPTDRPVMYGIVLPGPNVEDGVPVVKGGDVAPGRLRLVLLNRTTREIESGYVRSRLKAGDIVYAIRGSIGSVELVPEELCGANLTQDAARVSPKPDVDGCWLLYALRAQCAFGQVDASAMGATIRGVNIRDLKRVILAVPPLKEQSEIASYLSRAISTLDEIIFKTREQIAKFQEYRTALISAAVTGKIDVRGSAQV